MGKLITAVLAIAVLAGASWYALNHVGPSSTEVGGAPKRELDNVRQAAGRIESDADQRARDLDAKMQTAP